MRRFFATAALACAAVLAHAQSDNVVVGAGASIKCGDWAADRARSASSGNTVFREALALQWLQGYLSGLNTERMAASPNPTFGVPSHDVISAMVDKQCRDDPLQSLWLAAVAVGAELTKRSPLTKK